MKPLHWLGLAVVLAILPMGLGPIAGSDFGIAMRNLIVSWSPAGWVSADLKVGSGYGWGERDAMARSCQTFMAHSGEKAAKALAGKQEAFCSCFAGNAPHLMSRFDRMLAKGQFDDDQIVSRLRTSLRDSGISGEGYRQVIGQGEERRMNVMRECAAGLGVI